MSRYDRLELTDAETEAVEKLRERVSEDVTKEMLEDTFMFYRYLKVQDFNVDRAEIKIKETLEWRRQLKVDTIIEDFTLTEVQKKYFGNSRIAFDKEGRAVHYYPFGRMDSKGVHMSIKPTDLTKMVIQMVEKDERELLKKRKQPGAPYPGYVNIYDLEGLTFAAACDKKGLETYISGVKLYENHYPERIEVIYVINMSPYFGIAFNLAKNFLSSSFISKGQLLNGTDYKEEFLKIMDADVLPAFLGGNKTDPDGNILCKTIVNRAGKINESYYINKDKKSLRQAPDSKKLVLSRASFSEMELEIQEAGSVIEWEFETKTRDIGFGLFFKEMVDEEEKITEIVPLLRLDTEQFAETGVYMCENAGIYIMLFDNSYSWVRSKEIYYRTSIVKPEDVKTKIKHE